MEAKIDASTEKTVSKTSPSPAVARKAASIIVPTGSTTSDHMTLSADRTEDGRQVKLLAVIDESTRECLAIEVGHSFTARAVIEV